MIDYRDWHIPLGRRFRALKLWFVIRHYAPVPLSLVCFRHVGGDEINQRLMDRLNEEGGIYLTHTKLSGKLTLRMAIGSTHTERRHVERAWELIRETATSL